MCGIVGLSKRLGYSEASISEVKSMTDTFESMITQAEERGNDATGIFVYNTGKALSQYTQSMGQKGAQKKIYIYKEAKPISDVLKLTKYKQIKANIGPRTTVLIGHTRAASTATPMDNRNNHPHVSGNIIGVHNGYIRNWKELAKKHNLELKGGCDSEVIFALLNKFMATPVNCKDAMKKVASELDGSFAIAFFDTRVENQIAFMRRDAPLHLALYTHKNVLLFASSRRYIYKAARYMVDNKSNVSPNYIEISPYILEDNEGVVFNSDLFSYTTWVSAVYPFKLDA